MKRFLALLLAAMMILSCTAAYAAQGDALLGRGADDENLYFRACFTDGDTLYLCSFENLYTYHVGDADLTSYEWAVALDESEDTGVTHYPFERDGQLYAIDLYTSYGEYTEFVRAEIAPYELQDGKVVSAGAGTTIDWSDMLQYYDQDCYPVEPQNMQRVGSKLFLQYYDDQGDNNWRVIDLDAMKLNDLPDFTDVNSITPYRDGTLLLQMFNYNQSSIVRFQVYDPEAETLQPLSEITIPNYETFSGLCYDANADMLYCVKGGELCPLDVMTGEVGEGITDMPLEAYGAVSACMLNGGYYAFASEGAVVRNLDPGQKAASRLKIYDSTYNENVNNAYYKFSNANGDINVVLSRDESDGANIIESMMNRDSSVDIYVLTTASTAYEAVHNRGYMMELDGSEAVNALAARMYPSITEALSYNGRIVAVPVEAYCWTMGANEKALERIGLTIDDVPTNWSDFLDFLNTLPARIPEGSNITLFYPDMTVENVRSQLFYQIFNDYQKYVNATDPAIGYNTELLRGLLQKLDSVDLEAFGYEHEEDSDNGGMYSYSDGEDARLFDIGIGCTFGNFYSDMTPVLMAMDAQTPAYLVLETSVAFVNPFTNYPEQAMAFIDTLAGSLSDSVMYCVDPALDQPIRGEYNEKTLKDYQTEIEDLNRKLEQASEQDRQAIEESIRQWQENLDYIEKYAWDISGESIDWYRANDDHIVVMPANWLYSDSSGEAWDLISQYMENQISADELLESIDKKVQMMLLEGN